RALSQLTFTTDLNDLADRQLVIEAIVEDEAIKAEIFCELGRVVTDPNAVLASNTSSIPIMKIAAATKNPQRALGLHFFNPVPVCCRWSSWSAHWSPTKPRPLAPRSLLVQFWANRWCAARTVPALW
ncbi:MAG: 3-hydroxybutyryl-CoA dehydrogenase, partial [Mycobacterium sp.]|nr:3-hydroxybutyryl-CoA dehydrogenase [Mycobacterium sp.]